jgi:hypothetical protein
LSTSSALRLRKARVTSLLICAHTWHTQQEIRGPVDAADCGKKLEERMHLNLPELMPWVQSSSGHTCSHSAKLKVPLLS